jgi:hypothetical protein
VSLNYLVVGNYCRITRENGQLNENEPSGLSFLVKAAQEADFDSVTINNILYVDIAYIIDEAQTSYEDDELWLGPTKLLNNTAHRTGPRFCLFIAYSSPSAGPDVLHPLAVHNQAVDFSNASRSRYPGY